MHKSLTNLQADTGTEVINPKVTNIVYVTAPLNCVRMWKIRSKVLPISKTVIVSVSHGITSKPEKYKIKQTGQSNAALMIPMIVNVKAILPTGGGSPIILRNITRNTA